VAASAATSFLQMGQRSGSTGYALA
jgi:hypothetical protein